MTTTRRIDTPAGPFTVHLSGSGPRLLNLHGLTGLGERSRKSSPTGFELASYDQRGHGNGPRMQDPGAFRIQNFVDDAVAVLDGLGWDRVSVGGQSMGAAVALRLALDHPDRVEQLIITAPAFGAVPNPGAQRLGDMAARIDQAVDVDEMIIAMRQRMQDDGMPPEASAVVESFREHHLPSLAAAIRQVHTWAPFPDLAELGEIHLPSVVLGWPDDALHPWLLAEQTARFLEAPLGKVDNVFVALSDPGAIGRALDDLLTMQ